jgi:hypothetical protein
VGQGRSLVRIVAAGLLVAGLAGGLELGRMRDDRQAGASATLAVQADADDMQLLKARENAHAAARAWQREAEGHAAAKAAAEAQVASKRARKLTRAAVAARTKPKGPPPLVPYSGPIPSSCGEFVGNRAVGCALMLRAGFGIDQFPCLNKLWNKESGWNARASNAGSGAYGIPQALPGSKMGSAGPDWKSNPATQIKWGLGYIKGRYSSPCGAWTHSEAVGSY